LSRSPLRASEGAALTDTIEIAFDAMQTLR